MDENSVLVVEDNHVNRKLIVDVGSFHNIHMLEAADGHTALALTRTHAPALILMDIQLQGDLNGLDVAKEIRNDDKMKGIPLVAITAFAMKGDREMIMSAGYDEYIIKPFEMKELIDIFEKYLGNFERKI